MCSADVLKTVECDSPRNRTDLMTSKYSDTVSSQDIPKADGAVRRSCGHIVRVGMEAAAGDVS